MVPAQCHGRGAVALPQLVDAETALHEAIEPAIAHLATILEVAIGKPVEPRREVEVVVRRPVIADVGDLPIVTSGRSHNVVDTELRDQNARTPARLGVLKEKRQPHDRDVTDVEHRGARHQHRLRHPLHLAGLEVIVRHRQVAGGEFAVAGPEPLGARVHLQVAAHEPVGTELVERGEGVAQDRLLVVAGVEGDGPADQDVGALEEFRFASREHLAAGVVVANLLRLERGRVAHGRRAPPQLDPIGIRDEPRRVTEIAGECETLPTEEGLHQRVRLGELPDRRARQAESLGGRGIHRTAAGRPPSAQRVRRTVEHASLPHPRRVLRRQRAWGGEQPGREQEERRHLRLPPHQVGPEHPDLVEQEQRDGEEHHRHGIGAGREHRAGDERQHDRVAAKRMVALRVHHAECGEHDHDERKFEAEAQRQHHAQQEREIEGEGDLVDERVPIPRQQHLHRHRHGVGPTDPRAEQEEPQAGDQRRDHRLPLALVQRRGEKGPDLVEQHR